MRCPATRLAWAGFQRYSNILQPHFCSPICHTPKLSVPVKLQGRSSSGGDVEVHGQSQKGSAPLRCSRSSVRCTMKLHLTGTLARLSLAGQQSRAQ